MLAVAAERADAKAPEVEPGHPQLPLGPVDEVARQEAEDDVVARLERVEQLGYARQQLDAVVVALEFDHELGEVALEHAIHPRVHIGVGESRRCASPRGRSAGPSCRRSGVRPGRSSRWSPASARSIARRPAPFVQSSVPSMSNSAIFIRRAPVRARTAGA